jgi:hypothetical protein
MAVVEPNEGGAPYERGVPNSGGGNTEHHMTMNEGMDNVNGG